LLFGIDFLNFDKLSAIIFLILMSIFLYLKRKNLDLQPIIKIGTIPIMYVLLLRTKIGLKLMDSIAKNFRGLVKLFGYIAIGVGYLGMILTSAMMVFSVVLLFTKPEIENGAALLLPFTNIPGLGYLSFWHFIISILIIATIHEFAHGVVARAYDIKVKNSGVGALSLLIPFIPLAFVEPDEEEMKTKNATAQLSVFAAGPFINIVLSIIIAIFIATVVTPFDDKILEYDGFSYKIINESYPSAISGMTDSTLVSLNGEPIEHFTIFQDKMKSIKANEKITIGTKDGNYSLITTSSPNNASLGFIGIQPIENNVFVKEEYKKYSTSYFWLRGLLKWLFNLNLLVGLFNLLPLLVVDGGRMFQITVKKVFKKKKTSDFIIKIMALFLGSIILGMLMWTYVPKLIGLFGF
jgi:membrane-associated protease RseP (regulator of RpoE activity)